MSNSAVGDIYRDIIAEVINSSRMDFDDFGVEDATLHELQVLWQRRLSMAGVAKFPWDPEPIPSPPAMSQPSYPHPVGGIDPSAMPMMFSNPTMAAMRAAQQIQQFAQESKVPTEVADESIKGVMKRARVLDSEDDGSGSGLMLPGGGRMAQVDGADSDAAGPSTAAVDELVHARMAELTQRNLERIAAFKARVAAAQPQARRRAADAGAVLPQFDGALDSSDDDDDDDSEEDDMAPVSTANTARRAAGGDDSDAINSDLDDSEDEINSQNDEDADDSGMLMLCMYDKVQRTKNKWKCILKDGVVGINGRDYLFGKGNGEYEW
ncbi:transcription factor IIA, alpha/beta subunit [Dipodascopsis tothii]|uniref:transcription factor IIA, alpha/beta subunit n=1 Tax=Dipodascopsis tothii TaxID=44089 RepID=UPI0034CDD4D7